MSAHDPIGSDGLTAAERGDFLQRFQSAHDPRVTLTEAEIDRLVFEFGDHTNIYALTDTVADLIAARLAPIRALAEEWGAESNLPPSTSNLVDDLRTALDAPQDAPRGPVGGEQGAEVTGGRSDGERPGEAVLRVLRDLAERTDNAVRHLDDLHATRTSDMERARLTGKSEGAELIGGYIDEAIRLEGKR